MAVNEALAQQIAQAAQRAAMDPGTQGPPLATLLNDGSDAQLFVRSPQIASANWGGAWHPQLEAILGSQIQMALTKEHLAAQHALTLAANRMTFASVGLAAASVIGALVQIFV